MDKLLKLLDENARLTNSQLAVMLGITEQEAEDKISELERSGVIRGYKSVIDWERTDRAYVTALIELRVSPKRDLGFEEIAETIMRFDEVESVYLMSGGYDLSVIVNGQTFKDVAMFVAKRLSTLESVLSTATHFVLRRYKDSGVIFLGEEKDERGVL
ncbi:MAG: Lrp/AsnC family transcriptional regulator [Oscillospiraceae bacterium]|nr:Lrp/AsnC family transcriptional regulator [Oscillospiraceae bacterium]MDD4413827.1 Lrp/AsnC family transcriptional regulator [Oscillospiraceae bacterium]